ncbi:MAG: hypothetical protein RR753_05595, partial [Raoultibacter sp.]
TTQWGSLNLGRARVRSFARPRRGGVAQPGGARDEASPVTTRGGATASCGKFHLKSLAQRFSQR